ncbi:MAG: response regulator [Myxococcota bacterium]
MLSRAVLVDVTRQRQLEHETARTQRLLHSVFEALPDPAVLTTSARVILSANEAFTKVFGYRRAEVEGGTTERLYAQVEDYHRTGTERFASGARIDASPYPMRYRRADGEPFDAETVGVVIKGPDGSHLGNLGIMRDLTEQQAADRAQQELQERMMQAQKLESLGVLAGGIAHDFNNLLVAILGNADLAQHEHEGNPRAQELLSDITAAARRAADLCRQMLAYAGRATFEIRPVDLSAVVEDMASILDVSMSKKTVLQIELERDMPLIMADPAQLRQVIMNLLMNASEAREDKSGFVRLVTGVVEVSRSDLDQTLLGDECDPGYYALLEVTDTGCGMTDDVLAKLFEPFFTTKFAGRGLGLAAVLGIIRAHRGTLKIYSEVNRGTTFRVFLRLQDEPPSRPIPGAEAPPTAIGARGTVLVVDDEEGVRTVAKRMLGRLGFDVMLAPDGRSAVSQYRLRLNDIVLVFLDMTMPHLDGPATLRELRRLDPDVRAILMSGYSEQDVTDRLPGRRPNGFLQKPFDQQRLVEALNKALSDEE